MNTNAHQLKALIISVPEFGEKESKTGKSGTSGNQQQKSIKKITGTK